MTTESTLSTFTTADGENLAIQQWLIDEVQTLRGVVLIVHGLGEHAGRYDGVAQRLTDWGFAVRGYDQYGHGESGGVRGALPSDERLLDDLADVVDATPHAADGKPLILLGHSMGGLVAARFVSLRRRPVDGLVLSSPALELGLGLLQRLTLSLLPRIAPNFAVSNGLKPEWISHDPAVVAAYRADPLVHDRITGRLARFLADAGPATLACAPGWTVPTLLLWAGDDRLVSPEGSRAFASAAPPHLVTSQCFPTLYHEIFNELEREPVFDALRRWLDQRF